ncbi:homeodomain-interacting protein kinase 2-like [Epinephelus fuscoguttatus]|uniref:homeodomain-interacting protein kinase 2-like n=1 Tax=Epinephelus fuscoguttatus TaxID=293821 RepID=UPI0020D06812|nr:homeodomain-interacting protein kinase 2-like [Epinephelus fuscoguttatus]
MELSMELRTNVKEYQFIMERPVGAISSPSDFTLHPNMFPSNYELLQSLGEGGFGQVVQCFKKDTNETVAVKIMKYGCDYHSEMTILNVFKEMKLEEFNIVKFIDSFRLTNNRVALAFEMLDMTLKDYIVDHRNFTPMELCDIRSVVQQLAIALNTLKSIGLIHTDIKIDNIMLVDREEQPLRVKLIDFGLGVPTEWAEQDPEKWAPLQTKHFRALEIFLGLPFSEAIDMWSAGVMRWIVAFLGVPPDHLLDAATKSQHYFITDASGHWRLKTPEEYWQSTTVPSRYQPLYFSSLDILEELPQENLNMVGAEEKRECIDLLKAMLQIDPNERITPIEVLTHPFITRGTLHKNFDSSAPDGFHASTSETLPPGVIMVKSAPPECRLWGIEGSGQSESCPLDFLENVSENPPVEPTPLSTEDVEQELAATASDHTAPKKKKKEKRKRNCFKRFLAWTKRTFCCCIPANEDD